MAVKVAINGFGRIGRNVLRAIVESGRTDIEVVAINDLGPVETNAHLLRFDSVHGRFPHKVTVEGDTIDVGRGPIKVTAIKNPAELPHRDLGVEIALECTGIFTARDKAAAHLTAGAKRVLVSAPSEGADLTVVFGVNHDKLTKEHLVISNASCTTNCLAPVAKVLNDAVGIDHGFMTTVHSYTGDQPTLDTMHKDLYRGRAAALSMIPTTTGAAKAVGLVLPELKGKLDGSAIRSTSSLSPSGRRACRRSTTPSGRRRTGRSREFSGSPTRLTFRWTSTTTAIRRCSTWTRRRSWRASSCACCRGTTTNGASPTGWPIRRWRWAS
jgi:glyceraldehyde 3-phosphate dehydrogenase